MAAARPGDGGSAGDRRRSRPGDRRVPVVAGCRAPEGRFVGVRLTLARYLSLALEFQLAADILSTAIAPSWDQIGKLAAIAVIRTGLNYFLAQEVRNEAPAEPPRPAREQAPTPPPP